MKDIIVMAIESSCDETSCSIIKNGTEIMSNIVASQIKSHKRFGGVVPEVAARHHVEAITYVIDQALNESELKLEEIDAFSATTGPGLVGSLLVGVNAAKTLALTYNKPFISTHHIAGHIYANKFLTEFKFPLLTLVVSGGHTELVLMKDELNFEVIGETLDDAVGEAYDKVARVLDLPYPGGPHIDRLAKEGSPTYKLPTLMEEDTLNFSFSGIKSAVINLVHNETQRGNELRKADLACSFQEKAVELLIRKTKAAVKLHNITQVLVAGGVAANSRLRALITEELHDIEVVLPPLSLCTDNAAMIGACSYQQFVSKDFSNMEERVRPSIDL
jgi:N6-L-threonylcarbamoyladenine synthase